MALKIHRYLLTNDSNEKIPLLVPVWDSKSLANSGTYTVEQYLVAHPDFPYECTWFTGVGSQKANLENQGFKNVWSIPQIVDSGNTKWYLNKDKTCYIEFRVYNTDGQLKFVTPDNTSSWISFTSGNDDNNNYKVRCSSICSDTVLDNTFPCWIINTAHPDYLYFYYSQYCPSSSGLNLTIGEDFWRYGEELGSDPYSPAGTSGGGGGEGDFDDTSDTISIPTLPSISGLNTGFFTAFVCTQAQLQEVSNYLWTDVISDILDVSTGLGEKVDALKKMVTSPYDAIMGCSLVPVSPPTGGSKEIKMYGVIQTGISLPYASSRWVEVDCGTLNIKEFWGSYLDYSPYTKTTSLYLPYIGVVSVDIDLIMAKALQVVYHVDILTGICIAYIVVDGSVKFQYQGHCSTTIPVTSSDYSGAIQSGLGLVGNIANVVSSGVSGGLSGGLGGATLGAVGSAISQAPSVASNVMGMKPDIKSGGGVGSSGGILGVQKPFLIIERPKQSVPSFQNGFSGYPCNMTKKLSDLTGYTEVERINLENISLTEDEKNELLQILESGVYL